MNKAEQRERKHRWTWGDLAFGAEVLRWRVRRLLSRNEILRRLFRLPRPAHPAGAPGLLLLQIDGLSFRQLERAMSEGRTPFLKRLLARENYQLLETYSGLPSTTPAVQGELYYNVRCAVPSFGYLDRQRKEFAILYDQESAQAVETELRAAGEEPLLKDGSSWSNIYSGGAAPENCHFCGINLSWRGIFGGLPLFRMAAIALLYFPAIVRALITGFVELVAGLADVIKAALNHGNVEAEYHFIRSRFFVCTGLRHLIQTGVGLDLARGLPIIHANFLGYDERGHRRGPASKFAHAELKRIDRVIGSLHRLAQLVSTRDYQVWIFSDHGQETVRSIADDHPGGIGEIISRGLLKLGIFKSGADRLTQNVGTRASWLTTPRIREKLEAPEKPPPANEQDLFAVIARGPVAHLYLTAKLSETEKLNLAQWLAGEGGVPGVILRDGGNTWWVHSKGKVALPDEGPAFLTHREALRPEIAGDLCLLAKHKNAGDLILLGWHPDHQPRSFPVETGAHAGPGPEEVSGFALLPSHTRLPEGAIIRPSSLRAAALHALGRKTISARRAARPALATRELRVLTYNIHSCVGLDGRLAPGRIARIIRGFDPDVVALQEVDIQRPRSRGEDQAARLARELEMEVSFCCTVNRGAEKYGHALLSRFPVSVIASGTFGPVQDHPEPRGVLLASLDLNGRQVFIANTHFGLLPSERLEQMRTFLSPEWLGKVPADAPLVACGDFNMTPASPAYRLMLERLRDSQLIAPNFKPARTFPSPLPISRIDFVFVSRHFQVERCRVPRNSLTRVASDHLPLVVDLRIDGPPAR